MTRERSDASASGRIHSAEGSASGRIDSAEGTASGRIHSAEGRFAIVRATFYEDLAQRLTDGALKGFEEEGIERAGVDVFDVPGAFELPLAAKVCAESGNYAGVACLGAVIRGETDHYDWVCTAAAIGIEFIQIRSGVPCAFGVLTVDNRDQALARSGGDKRDQGYNAALVVVRMARFVNALSSPDA